MIDSSGGRTGWQVEHGVDGYTVRQDVGHPPAEVVARRPRAAGLFLGDDQSVDLRPVRGALVGQLEKASTKAAVSGYKFIV